MGIITHSNVFVYNYWKWKVIRIMVEDDELYIPKFTSEVGEGISTTDKVLRREITKMSEHINRLTYRINQLEKEITSMKIDAL